MRVLSAPVFLLSNAEACGETWGLRAGSPWRSWSLRPEAEVFPEEQRLTVVSGPSSLLAGTSPCCPLWTSQLLQEAADKTPKDRPARLPSLLRGSPTESPELSPFGSRETAAVLGPVVTPPSTQPSLGNSQPERSPRAQFTGPSSQTSIRPLGRGHPNIACCVPLCRVAVLHAQGTGGDPASVPGLLLCSGTLLLASHWAS